MPHTHGKGHKRRGGERRRVGEAELHSAERTCFNTAESERGGRRRERKGGGGERRGGLEVLLLCCSDSVAHMQHGLSAAMV